MKFKTRDMTMIALMAAIICVLGPLTVPFGPIPLTLANLAVYLAGAILGRKKGPIAVALYLLIGLVGVPVFSGFSGGFQKFAGPTGGFLVGDLPCAFIIGLAVRDDQAAPDAPWRLPVHMVLGTLALYACGIAWYMISTHSQLWAAISACMLPFLPADGLKIVVASLVAWPIRKALYGRRAAA